MFEKIKKAADRKTAAELFAFIVSGTISAGSAYAPLKESQMIAKAEPSFIEINEAVKDANGNVAVRATAAGIAALQAVQAAAVATPAAPVAAPVAASTEAQNFVILSNVPIPAQSRTGLVARVEIYPFSKLLKHGDMFFIPATAAKPQPKKSYASMVNSASKRYAKRSGNAFKFVIRDYEYNGVKGAGVWRIDTPELAVAAQTAAAPAPAAFPAKA